MEERDSSSERGQAAEIARCFVGARRQGVALSGYPGTVPATIEAAYRIQALAIAAWPDEVVGWKVGYIAPELREPDGDERLVGPIFARALRQAQPGRSIDFPVFPGGFAAVEAEFVFRLAADAPAQQRQWTPAQAAELAGDVHIGIETAGSPLATINELGPRVVISDFGNNAGMLLGPKIDGWRELPAPVLHCATFVDSHEVGGASVATFADGPLVALAFALSRCARNRRPLRAGDLVTTGALTGIHEIAPGQSARVEFGAFGSLLCRAVPAAGFAAPEPR